MPTRSLKTPRPLGLRLIVVYKFVKAPAMLLLAAALTFWPKILANDVRAAIAQASDWGTAATRIADWLQLHMTQHVEAKAAMLAWLDGVSTSVEGVLLATGRSWGEWLVVFGLSALVPFEVWSLLEHASTPRASILAINLVVAVYLWRRRVQHAPAPRQRNRAREFG